MMSEQDDDEKVRIKTIPTVKILALRGPPSRSGPNGRYATYGGAAPLSYELRIEIKNEKLYPAQYCLPTPGIIYTDTFEEWKRPLNKVCDTLGVEKNGDKIFTATTFAEIYPLMNKFMKEFTEYLSKSTWCIWTYTKKGNILSDLKKLDQ